MVTFKPFKAVRPKDQAMAKKIASPPYDVVNSEEALELAKNNKYSFLHIVKPEVDMPEYFKGKISLYDDKVYQKARDNFVNFCEKDWLIQDKEKHYYVYRQIMDEQSQYGLVGCVSAEDYWNNKIKKHENTRQAKEKDRVRHVETVNGNTGPVFLFYKNKKAIQSIVKKVTKKAPIYDFTSDDGVQHTVWQVSESDNIKTIQTGFKEVPHIYIADGHHRTASGAIVARKRAEQNPNHTGDEEYNFFLAVIFPAEQLNILDYNRVVKDLHGHSKQEFLNKITANFHIEENYIQRRPTEKSTFGMYLDNQWYLLRAKKGSYDPNDPVSSLDVSILMENLLKPILGIENPRTDDRIDFIGGIRGMDELEKRVHRDMKIAFSLYPTSIDELMCVADADRLMPPKSTWFEPKLRSGLLIHSYEE